MTKHKLHDTPDIEINGCKIPGIKGDRFKDKKPGETPCEMCGGSKKIYRRSKRKSARLHDDPCPDCQSQEPQMSKQEWIDAYIEPDSQGPADHIVDINKKVEPAEKPESELTDADVISIYETQCWPANENKITEWKKWGKDMCERLEAANKNIEIWRKACNLEAKGREKAEAKLIEVNQGWITGID